MFVMGAGSLPSWERGLKFDTSTFTAVGEKSLPSWERGLKFMIWILLESMLQVAPLVGAWIEI